MTDIIQGHHGIEVQDLDLLSLIAQALTNRVDPLEAVEIAVRQAIARLDADGGLIALLHPDGQIEPIFHTGYPLGATFSHGELTLDSEVPLTEAIRLNETVWLSSIGEANERYPRFMDHPVRSQAWAAIPLALDGAAFGTIGLSFAEPRTFPDGDRQFLTLLSDLTALALAYSGRTNNVGRMPRTAADDLVAGARTSLNYQVSARMLLASTIVTKVRDRQATSAADRARLDDAVHQLNTAQSELRSIVLEVFGRGTPPGIDLTD
ncbi:MAG: GAF domain-containing protein [Acidimicrobiales bacterium]